MYSLIAYSEQYDVAVMDELKESGEMVFMVVQGLQINQESDGLGGLVTLVSSRQVQQYDSLAGALGQFNQLLIHSYGVEEILQ